MPVAHREIFLFFIFYYSFHLPCAPLFNSPPDLHQQSRKRLESQNHSPLLRALWWGHIIRMSAFSAKPENETARCRSTQIFHQPGGHYGHCKPSCSCYKSVMHLPDCSPSASTASNPPHQFIRRLCLLLPTRSSPGLPRTPARANCLAHGALCTDSR